MTRTVNNSSGISQEPPSLSKEFSFFLLFMSWFFMFGNVVLCARLWFLFFTFVVFVSLLYNSCTEICCIKLLRAWQESILKHIYVVQPTISMMLKTLASINCDCLWFMYLCWVFVVYVVTTIQFNKSDIIIDTINND